MCIGRCSIRIRSAIESNKKDEIIDAISALCDLIPEKDFPRGIPTFVTENVPQMLFSILCSDDQLLSKAAFSAILKLIEIIEICQFFATPEYCKYVMDMLNAKIALISCVSTYDQISTEIPKIDEIATRNLLYILQKFLKYGTEFQATQNFLVKLDITPKMDSSPQLQLGPNLNPTSNESEAYLDDNPDSDIFSEMSISEDKPENDCICDFLLQHSLLDSISILVTRSHNSSLVDLCFDTLEALCCHFLRTDDASIVLNIISSYRPIPRASILNKILRLFLFMFSTRSLANRRVFSRFEELGFLELTQSALGGRVDEPSTFHACLVAAHIYENFPDCNYQFHMRRLLELSCSSDFTSPISEKVATAAAQALAFQLQANPPLARNILKTPKIYQSLLTAAAKRSIRAKISLTDILAYIAKFTNVKIFPTLLSELDVGGERMNIFTFASDICGISPGATKKALRLLLALFERGTELGMHKHCQAKFLRAFEDNFFVNCDVFSDDETAADFEALKEYLSHGQF
ncbi:hypothetical protein TRFO_13100 [Tritrichomonas foetus]|uniref:Uncharacterized protein n=1 Tax=Tritrichomonas foetus TaxID=1144522 RepID=A0A1J4KZ40_9EUKA|nr:hypothetical protein TRFO_13100 [Tritrichomonas foetus]|eukprot:OHT16523.1 hypothetical protein TRFO_13100 [Tritrichomonas foetus]